MMFKHRYFKKKYYGKLSNPQDYIQGIGILFSKTAKYNTFYVPAQVELNIFWVEHAPK